MAVPSVITDLNVSAASNSPAGTDPIGNTLDDFLRGIQAIVRREQAQGAAIASAATTSIASNTDGNYVHITGTTTITSFGTVAAGVSRTVVFDGVLTLTHNASSLVLPGGANIITAPNDIAEFVSEGSGNWRCVKYVPASQYYLSKSIAGGTDVTLTSAESGAWVINLTGVLTANINLIFPTTLKQWLVVNNTTGAFTVTCKTASGTGSAVTQSGYQNYYGDGTNLVAGAGTVATTAVQGTIKNLLIASNGSSPAVTITIDEIVVESGANAKLLKSVSVFPSMVVSGANGLDTGSLANNTWYSVWVIWNGVTNTTAGLYSLSATSPTLPSGYTYSARIGWVRTQSSGNNLLATTQKGRRAQYAASLAPQMASGVSGTVGVTLTAISSSSFVPSTASAIKVLLYAVNSSTVQVSPNTVATLKGGPGIYLSPPPSLSLQIFADFTLESANVYYAGDTSTSALYCLGWEDNL